MWPRKFVTVNTGHHQRGQVCDVAKKHGSFFFLFVCLCVYGVYTCTPVWMHVCAGACGGWGWMAGNLPQFLFDLIHWGRVSLSNPGLAIRLISPASLLWGISCLCLLGCNYKWVTMLPWPLWILGSELQFFFLGSKHFIRPTSASRLLSVWTVLLFRRCVLTFWSQAYLGDHPAYCILSVDGSVVLNHGVTQTVWSRRHIAQVCGRSSKWNAIQM